MADDAGQYCVCQQVDSGIMIECIRGDGGCHGWVHPACCGLLLTPAELEAIDSYICPLCERPSDDDGDVGDGRALNTKQANRLAKRQRKKQQLRAEGDGRSHNHSHSHSHSHSHIHSHPHSHSHSHEKKKKKRDKGATSSRDHKPWRCKQCGFANASRAEPTCGQCQHVRSSSSSSSSSSSGKKKHTTATARHGDDEDEDEDATMARAAAVTAQAEADEHRRRSGRESNKKRKNYHVPNSDEDVGLSDGDEDGDHGNRKKTRKRGGKRRRGDDGAGGHDDDDQDDYDGRARLTALAPPRGVEVLAPVENAPNMVIEKIMGVRQRAETAEEKAAAMEMGLDANAVAELAKRPVVGAPSAPGMVTEYYIKWKGFSYLHCSWERRDVLLAIDLGNKQRLKRFHEKELLHGHHRHHQHHRHHHHHRNGAGGEEEGGAIAVDESEVEYFNPEYLEVHRIISHRREFAPPVPVVVVEEKEEETADIKPLEGVQAMERTTAEPMETEPSTQTDHSELKTETEPDRELTAAQKESQAMALEDKTHGLAVAVGPTSPRPAAPVVDDGMRYLVKWRVLPYTDATWERACDLTDDAAIAQYEASRIVPPKEEWEPLPRPSLREYRKIEESPRFGTDGTLALRAYQLEGLNWLLWNYYNERPSILADEMGLGKTIQTLAFLDSLRRSERIRCRGPFLVVAPLSLIAQWQSECETWTTMNCVVYHGNTDAREIIRDFEFYYLEDRETATGRVSTAAPRPDKKKPFKFHILVTTYEVAIKDISFLSKIRWRCLVVDEAHRLKNQSSRLVEQLRSLRRDHCVLLTGTPLQNKTEELWALLNFLDGHSFPSVTDFLDKFGDLHEAQQVADLHKMLKPYLLRRVKEDVEKSLPPKEETIIEVELTPVQKQWYRAIYERNTSFLSRGGNPNNVPNLMNVMMELRKCCNHPYLNNGVEERLNDGIPLTNDAARHDMMVKCCGKMVLLDKLLPRLKDGGHKVLIFSQMVRVLDIIEDYLRYMGYIHERLDGNIRGNDRQAAVDRFVKPEYQRFVMLLSTKAGGLGLNLTAADTVIIFDSDWNPQNDLQAQARAHRIGQTHSVKIYRLITRKTYEMHMFHKASLKLGLDKAVLTHMRREKEEGERGNGDGDRSKSKKSKSSKAEEAKEIDELLKRGAYDVFRDDDSAGEQFCAADIDQILKRSSQIVQYEQQAQSSFSKASFVSATTSDDVDIDDPDFWKKAVGLDEPEPTAPDADLPLQRKRTRVSRFGTANGHGGLDSDDEHEDAMDKKERHEAEKKEREERELRERERERAEEKAREPRDWTLNGRDRLQRALMHFGFGRWEIIRNQSGGSRTVDEVELFGREFIYACAHACAVEMATNGPSSSSRDDSPFIKSLMRASLHASREHLVDESELPSVLTDDEFVVKLKQGGGRRVLIRLDMLWRLTKLVVAACDALDAEYNARQRERADAVANDPQPVVATDKSTTSPLPAAKTDTKQETLENGGDAGVRDDTAGMKDATSSGDGEAVTDSSPTSSPTSSSLPPPPATVEPDDRVAYYGVDAVSARIKLADISDRPVWTQITPWWDEQADRSLLLGVFLHGYGRCTQILSDSRLRFGEIAMAAAAAPTTRGEKQENDEQEQADGSLLTPSSSPTKAGKPTADDTNEEEDEDDAMQGSASENEDEEQEQDEDHARARSSVKAAVSKKEEGNNDHGATDMSQQATTTTTGEALGAYKQPEVQQMNRLLFWLLSADDIKRQREADAFKKERAGLEQQRQSALERQQRVAALHRVELKAMQLAQMDAHRHLALVANARQMPSPMLGAKMKQKDWSKEERRTFSYLLALHGAPRILAKSVAMARLPSSSLSSPFNEGSDRVPSFARSFMWQADSLSWMNFVQWGKLNKTATMARAFYEQRHLPKCLELADMRVDPLASDHRAMALADLVGIEFVDAHEGVLAHGLKARNTAWVTLRRVQLLEDVLMLLARPCRRTGQCGGELAAYLRSGNAELVANMPVWWCPWIHDLGVFYGMARYGVSGWERMLLDRTLPFHRDAREQHIRAVFLEGSAALPPLYPGGEEEEEVDSRVVGELDAPINDAEKKKNKRKKMKATREAWLRQVVEELPSLAVLERKVQRICHELLERQRQPRRRRAIGEGGSRADALIPRRAVVGRDEDSEMEAATTTTNEDEEDGAVDMEARARCCLEEDGDVEMASAEEELVVEQEEDAELQRYDEPANRAVYTMPTRGNAVEAEVLARVRQRDGAVRNPFVALTQHAAAHELTALVDASEATRAEYLRHLLASTTSQENGTDADADGDCAMTAVESEAAAVTANGTSTEEVRPTHHHHKSQIPIHMLVS